MIPMRDGVALPTDIYLPEPHARNLPCILLRGPRAAALIRRPYLSRLPNRDMRSRFRIPAPRSIPKARRFLFLADGWGEQQDGFDTVEWLAKHPVTNGKVGTLGYSNMGITQLLLAPTTPQGLTCQYIGVAAPSLYHHAIFPGGKYMKNQVEGWLGLCARHPSVIEWVRSQQVYNEFWESVNALPHSPRVNVPALHIGGWYDTFIQGTLDAYVSRQSEGGAGARGTQKLVIGPWVHRLQAAARLGEFPNPPKSFDPPYDISPKNWFDFYLKKIPNQIDALPPVLYYVMGPFDGSESSGNRWRTADRWPVPHSEMALYLTADKRLTEEPGKVASGRVSYPYRHDDSVPTIGGRNLFLEAGPMDQSSIEKRSDVALFTSDALSEDLEVTGRIIAHLIFSSDREKADIAVRLTDVYPDGRSVLIAEGLSHVGKAEEKEVNVDLWSTSLVFARGHKIRLSVSGSNYPRYDGAIPHLDGTDSLHMAPGKLSRLILPVVRKGDRWLAL